MIFSPQEKAGLFFLFFFLRAPDKSGNQYGDSHSAGGFND
jgi:hypothetical protein